MLNFPNVEAQMPSPEICRQRVRAFQEQLAAHNVDAYMILTAPDYHYFIGETRHQPRALIARSGDPILIAYESEKEEILEHTWIRDIRTFTNVGEMMRAVHDLTKELGIDAGAIALEYGFGTPAFLVDRFKQVNPKARLVPVTPLVAPLRMVKSVGEVALMREAARIAQIGIDAAIRALKPGITENEVAAEAEYAMRKAGAEGMAVGTLVNSGYRSNWLHGTATHKKIHPGELILIDVQPTYYGYCADLARPVVLGKPTAEQTQLAQAYITARQAALKLLKPGISPRMLDMTMAAALKPSGYDTHWVRGLVHGIGLAFEETPMPTIIPPEGNVALPPGAVLSVGHSVLTVPAIGGVRFEDMVLVTESGWEPLSTFTDSITVVE